METIKKSMRRDAKKTRQMARKKRKKRRRLKQGRRRRISRKILTIIKEGETKRKEKTQ